MATQSGGWYGTTCTLFFVQFISRLQNLATANVFLGEIHITKDSENPKWNKELLSEVRGGQKAKVGLRGGGLGMFLRMRSLRTFFVNRGGAEE